MSLSEIPEFQQTSQQLCVLFVEDDLTIRKTVTLALSEEGYDVITAEDGRQALTLIHSATVRADGTFSIDLIILDLILPYVNGLDICRSFRQQNTLTPVLILSARGSEMDIVVGLEVGADDYLIKPFGLRELLARCRVLLRRSRLSIQPFEQPVLKFQEVTLYLQEYRITVRGEAVSLSPKEFMLLELFMRYPRRVFSRDQLLEQIWGIESVSDPKTVDVHIRWLREKVETDPSAPELHHHSSRIWLSIRITWLVICLQ